MTHSTFCNSQLALHIFRELYQMGVRELCVCPGARNAPWIAWLVENPSWFRTYYFYEERSAAFFALGRIRSTQNPVAVLTTSGTAVGELLPATMEAYYSGLPLVLLTADRPRAYRGKGTPQTAEQVGIFGIFAEKTFDIEGDERLNFSAYFFSKDSTKSRSLPIHINACFDEPLIKKTIKDEPLIKKTIKDEPLIKKTIKDEPLSPNSFAPLRGETQLKEFFQKVRNPLIIVGMLSPLEREPVIEFLKKFPAPVILESTSGLREKSDFDSHRIHITERIIELAEYARYPVDGVIRIGGVPTLRFWRDLENKYLSLPVISLSHLDFSGLGRNSYLVSGSMDRLCYQTEQVISEIFSKEIDFTGIHRWIELDQQLYRRFRELLLVEPQSEPGLIYSLSKLIPKRSRIYLGNSLPIREWDLAAAVENQNFEIWASRGLNGIDGQVSSFLGFAQEDIQNWALVGDLTALYDLAGPWILSQMKQFSINIGIINNGGGKIFSRMFPYPEFINQHSVRFKPFAELWGLNFETWYQIPPDLNLASSSEPKAIHPLHRMIEIIPHEESTARFWKQYQELIKSLPQKKL